MKKRIILIIHLAILGIVSVVLIENAKSSVTGNDLVCIQVNPCSGPSYGITGIPQGCNYLWGRCTGGTCLYCTGKIPREMCVCKPKSTCTMDTGDYYCGAGILFNCQQDCTCGSEVIDTTTSCTVHVCLY